MISREEVTHIAKLARLELTEKEVEKMQKDLSSILDYFNSLKGVKLEGRTFQFLPMEKNNGSPMSAKAMIDQLRKDEVLEKSSSLANNLVQQAPDKKDNYIKVKSIL